MVGKKLFLVGALILGSIFMIRATFVRAETIQLDGFAISAEFTGSNTEAEIGEQTFLTLPLIVADLGEGTFTTPAMPTSNQPVSAEGIFQTLLVSGNESDPSTEKTFTTLPVDDSPPGGGGGGSGGGGSGGGGGSSSGGSGGSRHLVSIIPPASISSPDSCPVYLTKFIHFARDNDPVEVLKLQRFLRDYEGFSDVPLSGVYDRVTYQAVKIFQTRYAKDILKPWGIDYSTGYVYITTTLAINNLYCERDPATTLDLRSRFTATGIDSSISTTTPTSTPIFLEVGEATGVGRLLLAALGVLDFFKLLPFWWRIFLILLVIFYLAWKLFRRRRRHRPSVGTSEEVDDEADSR